MDRGAATALAPLEHEIVRTENALGPARQHAGNALQDLAARRPEPLAQQGRQRESKIAAGEIVDAAIAFGLADHRGNIGRREGARIEQGGQAREISGMLHRQAMDVGLHGDGHREALYAAEQ